MHHILNVNDISALCIHQYQKNGIVINASVRVFFAESFFFMLEERIPIVSYSEEQPDACVTWSEKTFYCAGCKVKRWCCLLGMLSVVMVALLVPLGVYVIQFGEATSCRLTYADNAVVTESKMQSWMSKESWPLTVPSYDWTRRTCVCKGFEDKDPKNLTSTDEVLVWIAPGDLVSLSDEGKITPPLDAAFTTAHRNHYGQSEHVKVCIRQELVLDLWNIDNVTDEGHHCHQSKGDGSSNVENIFLGWDGALFCSDCTGQSCTMTSQCCQSYFVTTQMVCNYGKCVMSYNAISSPSPPPSPLSTTNS
jgi:hypothetical protein